MQFSPVSCNFISFRTKYSPQHPVFKHHHPMFVMCIYIYIYVCVCVCVCVRAPSLFCFCARNNTEYIFGNRESLCFVYIADGKRKKDFALTHTVRVEHR
jgi:hypothetical protein